MAVICTCVLCLVRARVCATRPFGSRICARAQVLPCIVGQGSIEEGGVAVWAEGAFEPGKVAAVVGASKRMASDSAAPPHAFCAHGRVRARRLATFLCVCVQMSVWVWVCVRVLIKG